MLKFVAIPIIFLTLAGSVMDLHDLIKLPRLLEHYIEHNNSYGNLTFWDFINQHYGSESDKHEKEQNGKHAGLPFKSSNCASSHIVALPSRFYVSKELIPITGNLCSNFYRSTYTMSFSESIWQPPKAS